jgi:hypothetical protein
VNKGSAALRELLARDSCMSEVTFQLFRAYEVDSDGTMLAYFNTDSDGYCMFRASLQALLRFEDPALTVKQLKAIDMKTKSDKLVKHIQVYADAVKFANPHTNLFHQAKLAECLFNAEHFPDQRNPPDCWGDSCWMRFLKFDVVLLDFMDDHRRSVIGGKMCKWGQVSRVPFHYFGTFFYGVPNMTQVQLQDLVRKANYVGFSPGHNFVLENPTVESQLEELSSSILSWINGLVPAIVALSDVELELVRQLGVTLRTSTMTAPLATIRTSIGIVDVDTALVPVTQYTDRGEPICCDTLFELCPNGSFNKHEVDAMLSSVIV